MSLISLYSFVLFTPLEQFDNVVWLSSRGFETVDAYPLFVLETEFNAAERTANPTSGVSTAFTARLSGGVVVAIVALVAFSYALPALGTAGATVVNAFTPVSRLALVATLHVLTGAFATVWRADLFYLTGVAGTDSVGFAFAPQVDRTFGIDETRISLLLAFGLLGGGEEADEEDALLPTSGDFELVEDVVAPLFITNLGKDNPDNGALYLKVCAIFGFILASNLAGRLPYADTVTSSLGLTFRVALAVFVSLYTLRIQRKGINYVFSLFRPAGCPLPLLFLLVPIEFISTSFRVVSLSVRLFANRRAGHTLRKVLIGFSYTFLTLGDLYAVAAFLPGLVVFLLVFLERGVAAVQTYIFTLLTCLYLKDIYVAH
jgi:ATP synthase subunit 6